MKKLVLLSLATLFGATAAFSQVPQRIVTVGGTVTEIVFALGQGARVAGVDTSSIYPPQAIAALPKVGYIRQLPAEGLLSLAPDLVITTVDAGPPSTLAQIKGAGVKVVVVPAGSTWEAAQARITFLADLLGAKDAGAKLVSSLQASRSRVSALVQTRKTTPKVLFVYARGAGTLMVSGTGTEADAIIALAGGVNVVTAYEGYRPLTPEALVAARPDVILFTSGGLQSLGGKEGLAALPPFADKATLAHAQVGALDDLLLLGFGPRLGEAVEALEGLFASASRCL